MGDEELEVLTSLPAGDDWRDAFERDYGAVDSMIQVFGDANDAR